MTLSTEEHLRLMNLGWEQQDVVAFELQKRGWPICSYQSKAFQIALGENTVGLEIKLDQRWHETGNLYLEVFEKNDPNQPEWVKSGISLDPVLFCIGDRTRFWIFGTGVLRRLVKSGICQKTQTPTSKGFLLPVDEAIKHAVWDIEVSDEAHRILERGEWVKEYDKLNPRSV